MFITHDPVKSKSVHDKILQTLKRTMDYQHAKRRIEKCDDHVNLVL